MICSKCGADSPEGLKFCENCGAPMQAARQAGAKGDGQGQQAKRVHSGAEKRKPTVHSSSQRRGEQQGGVAHDSSTSAGSTSGHVQPAQTTPSPQQAQAAQGGAPSRLMLVLGIVVVAVLFMSMSGMCSSPLGEPLGLATGGGAGGIDDVSLTQSGGTLPASVTVPEDRAAASDDTWTILFYLCGSNLETDQGLATFNLQEIAQADLGDNVTFAIESGGARRWKNSSYSAKNLTRSEFRNGSFKVVDRLPAQSMAVSSTLEDFVDWGTRSYPADHYALVFWDHGAGAVFGVCSDELFPGNSRSGMGDTLTVAEIDEALAASKAKFDLIGFDTCLMATVETAAKLAPYADYLVASEETEPGYGWDYVGFPEWLAGHTGATGAMVGQQICDTYYTKCRRYGVADMATLSVVDLSKAGALSRAFLGASEEMAQATASKASLKELYRAAYGTTRFGSDTAYNMIDLGGLMGNARGIVGDRAGEVVAALGDAVLYQVHGRSRPNVTGLSVFYPLDTSNSDMFFGYLDVVENVPYAQFLAVMYGTYDKVDWDAYASSVTLPAEPVAEDDISIKYDEQVNDDGALELRVTRGQEDVAMVNMQLSLFLPDVKTVVYLGTDYDVNNPSEGVYQDNFHGEWMAIDGTFVCAVLLEHGDGYNLYYVPAKVNGARTNLIAAYDFEKDAYEVLCACDEPEANGMSSKSLRALEEGDEIEFVMEAYVLGTDNKFEFAMGKTTWSDDVTMESKDVVEGTYLYSFQITDVLGQTLDTDLYVQDYERGGSISVERLEDYLA